MEAAGYFSSILIGITLGLIGGGGSILTVPVLVYLFSIDAVAATVYSLFIVGATSIVGSFAYFKKDLVDIKTVAFFGIPSIAAVFITRIYIAPAIPEEVFHVGDFTVTRNIMIMMLFAMLMVATSYSMIRKDPVIKVNDDDNSFSYTKILLHGTLIGCITGLIGAGGGFLIIPVLVNMFKMPIKKAIGTSLVIIALNSLFGFISSLTNTVIHWKLLFSITLIAIVGVFIGAYISARMESKKLKPVFGWFVLIMGVYIFIKEISLN